MAHRGEPCESLGKWKVLSFTSPLALALASGMRLDAQTDPVLAEGLPAPARRAPV
jgi:hypothetical protein